MSCIICRESWHCYGALCNKNVNLLRSFATTSYGCQLEPNCIIWKYLMDFNLWFFATKIVFLRSYWSKFVVDSLSCTQLHVVSQSAPTHVNGWSGYSAIAPKMFIVTCKFVTQSKYINKTETETNGMPYGWIFLTFAIKNMWFCMHHWSVVEKLHFGSWDALVQGMWGLSAWTKK